MSCISLVNIFNYLSENFYPIGISFSDKRSIRKRAESFVVKDNTLYYCPGWRKFTPEEQEKAVLKESPLEETGQKQIIAQAVQLLTGLEPEVQRAGVYQKLTSLYLSVCKLISERYYWVGIPSDVKKYLGIKHKSESGRTGTAVDDDSPTILSNADLVDLGKLQTDTETGHTEETIVDDVPPEQFIRRFWQKVEICLLGPYNEFEPLYVLVCIDVCSQWTELAVVSENNTQSVVHFLFNLFCRYGAMETICWRSGDIPSRLEEVLNLVTVGGSTIHIQHKGVTNNDLLWQRLLTDLDDFARNTSEWQYKMENFLLPYRILQPLDTDYTPAYFCYGRELVMPNGIGQNLVSSQTTSSSSNMYVEDCGAMTPYITTERTATLRKNMQELLERCEEVLSQAPGYDQSVCCNNDDDDDCNDTTSIGNSSLTGDVFKHDYGDLYSAIKLYIEMQAYPPNYQVSMKRAIRKLAHSYRVENDKLFHLNGQRELREVVMEERDQHRLIYHTHTRISGHLTFRETYQELTDKFYWRGISADITALVKACGCSQRFSMSPEPITTATTQIRPMSSRIASRRKMKENQETADGVQVLENLKSYLINNAFPTTCSPDDCRLLRLRAKKYFVEDDSLYYRSNDGTSRQVLITLDERFDAIEEAHLIEGVHVVKKRTYDRVLLNSYWPGVVNDVNSFVSTCPVCNATKNLDADRLLKTRGKYHSVLAKKIDKFMELMADKDYFAWNGEGEGLITSLNNSNVHGGTTAISRPPTTTDGDVDINGCSEETAASILEGLSKGRMRLKPVSDYPHISTNEQVDGVAADQTIVNNSCLTNPDAEQECGEDEDEIAKIDVKPNVSDGKILEATSTTENDKPADKYMRRICEKCGETFRGKRAIALHVHSCGVNKALELLCDICGELFDKLRGLNMHRSLHDLRYKCHYCDKILGSKGNFKRHLRVHEQSKVPHAYKKRKIDHGDGTNRTVTIYQELGFEEDEDAANEALPLLEIEIVQQPECKPVMRIVEQGVYPSSSSVKQSVYDESAQATLDIREIDSADVEYDTNVIEQGDLIDEQIHDQDLIQKLQSHLSQDTDYDDQTHHQPTTVILRGEMSYDENAHEDSVPCEEYTLQDEVHSGETQPECSSIIRVTREHEVSVSQEQRVLSEEQQLSADVLSQIGLSLLQSRRHEVFMDEHGNPVCFVYTTNDDDDEDTDKQIIVEQE